MYKFKIVKTGSWDNIKNLNNYKNIYKRKIVHKKYFQRYYWTYTGE